MPIPAESLECALVPLMLMPAGTVAELLALFAAQVEPTPIVSVEQANGGALVNRF